MLMSIVAILLLAVASPDTLGEEMANRFSTALANADGDIVAYVVFHRGCPPETLQDYLEVGADCYAVEEAVDNENVIDNDGEPWESVDQIFESLGLQKAHGSIVENGNP